MGRGGCILKEHISKTEKKTIASFRETRTDPVDFANSLPRRSNTAP